MQSEASCLHLSASCFSCTITRSWLLTYAISAALSSTAALSCTTMLSCSAASACCCCSALSCLTSAACQAQQAPRRAQSASCNPTSTLGRVQQVFSLVKGAWSVCAGVADLKLSLTCSKLLANPLQLACARGCLLSYGLEGLFSIVGPASQTGIGCLQLVEHSCIPPPVFSRLC